MAMNCPKAKKMKKALQNAIYDSSVTAVRSAIELGANVNLADRHGSTPLIDAIVATNFNFGAVEFLVHHGANVNYSDKLYQWRPLHYAVSENKLEVVRLLLDLGVDVEPRDKNGRTPLFVAIRRSDSEIVKLLLERGADPYCVTKVGRSPYELAVRFNREDLVGLFDEWRLKHVAG